MSANSICEYLEWDSEFFGRRIARVTDLRLTEETLAAINDWCGAEKIDCLYFLADSADRKTVRLAGNNAFRLVDIRVTLDLGAAKVDSENSDSLAIRNALESDIPVLRAIARSGHRDSRFYFDEKFPHRLCDLLYETWVEKSCRGWAKNVLVVEENGNPAGYVTCHLTAGENGQIGLVAVAENAQGKGIGKTLVSGAVGWFAEQSVGRISVVTQGRNVRAQRLYQRCGFVTRSMELWFHRWFS